MSEKKPTSVNLRLDHIEWLDRENINRSALFNDLLDEYRFGRSYAENAAAEYMLQELELKERAKESELDAIREQRRVIKERQESVSEESEEIIEWCLENWSYLPDEIDAGVKNQAKKTDMEPEELLEEVADRWGENDA